MKPFTYISDSNSDPVSALEGTLYWNSSEHVFRIKKDGVFVNVVSPSDVLFKPKQKFWIEPLNKGESEGFNIQLEGIPKSIANPFVLIENQIPQLAVSMYNKLWKDEKDLITESDCEFLRHANAIEWYMHDVLQIEIMREASAHQFLINTFELALVGKHKLYLEASKEYKPNPIVQDHL